MYIVHTGLATQGGDTQSVGHEGPLLSVEVKVGPLILH